MKYFTLINGVCSNDILCRFWFYKFNAESNRNLRRLHEAPYVYIENSGKKHSCGTVCVNSSLSFNKTFVSYLLETPKRQRFAFVQCLHSVTVWNTLCKDNKL